MYHKVVFSSIIILISILLFTACNNSPDITTQSASTMPPISSQVSSSTTTERPGPILDLRFSSIPKLGETVDLSFDIKVQAYELSLETRETLINSEARVDIYRTNLKGSYSEAKYAVKVPLKDVLISGDTSWQGDARYSDRIELHSKIQLPQEGLWKIEGSFSGDNWTSPLTKSTKIVLLDGLSSKYDYYSSDPNFKAGPLGYLTNFNYGDMGRVPLIENFSDLFIETDISKAPKAGEEATVTVQIDSLHDVSDFSAEITLLESGKGWISPSDFVVSGFPSWIGDLKANQISKFSIIVKFPETGDWEILVSGNSKERELNQRGGYADSIKITITPAMSYFGWMEITPTRTFPERTPQPAST
jgi:hypothetical protein